MTQEFGSHYFPNARHHELRLCCVWSVVVQPKSLEHYLSQEDPRLLSHLKSTGALAQLPYGLWFRRCFAGCLPESSLQRSDNPLVLEL